MRYRGLAFAVCSLLLLPGCLIVVDHSDTQWSDDADSLPRRAIGVYLESVDEAAAAQLGLDRARVTLVERVVHDSPAQRAGLQRYDIITAVDGDTDASPSRVRQAVRARKAGESMALSILRHAQPQTITVVK